MMECVKTTESHGFIERLMGWSTRTTRKTEEGWGIQWFNGPHIVWARTWKMFRSSDNGYGFGFEKYDGRRRFYWLSPVKFGLN